MRLPALNTPPTPGIRRGLSSAAGPQPSPAPLRSAPPGPVRQPRRPVHLTCSPAAGPRRPRSSRTSAPRPVAAAPSRQAPGWLGAPEGQTPELSAATAAPREKQKHGASGRGGEGRRARNPRGTHRRAGLRHDSVATATRRAACLPVSAPSLLLANHRRPRDAACPPPAPPLRGVGSGGARRASGRERPL